jgi:hypothetical protein
VCHQLTEFADTLCGRHARLNEAPAGFLSTVRLIHAQQHLIATAEATHAVHVDDVRVNDHCVRVGASVSGPLLKSHQRAVQVLASSWFDSWRRDMRASSMMYRVAEGGMRAVGQGTMWTVGAVAGVGRATTRVMTSCVAAR